MSYERDNMHENVVNDNEWWDLECLQKPTETDIETGGGLFSDTGVTLAKYMVHGVWQHGSI